MANSLQNLVAQFLTTDDDWRKKLMRDWSTIVGGLHTKMRLEKIVHDTVVIGVYESHWMQELYMISSAIMQTMNEKLGGPYVAKLRFVVADAKKQVKKKHAVEQENVQAQKKPLSPRQQKALEKIEDAQLRESLKKLWQRCQS